MNWESQSPLFGEVEKDWFRLPDDVPVSTIFVDESGAKNSSGGFFVVGFLKARESAALDREIRHLRQRHKFFEEMKFSGIKRESLRFFYDMVELVADSDVRVGGVCLRFASIIHRSTCDLGGAGEHVSKACGRECQQGGIGQCVS